MAREIKFRAWYKAAQAMCPVISIGFDTKWVEMEPAPDSSLIDQMSAVELMQYTGLKDKNGKPIYEGDIVYVKQNIYAQKHLTVEWGVDRWEFKEEFDNGDYYYGYAIRWEEVEVIGNIYENSDLLDKQT